MCEIYSKLTVNTKNDVNDVILVSLSLTLNRFHMFSSVFIVDFEHVNIDWVLINKYMINPFHTTGFFLYIHKTEKPRFSNVFRGYKKRPMA